MTISHLMPSLLSQEGTQAQRGKVNSSKLDPFLEAGMDLELRSRKLSEIQSFKVLAGASF